MDECGLRGRYATDRQLRAQLHPVANYLAMVEERVTEGARVERIFRCGRLTEKKIQKPVDDSFPHAIMYHVVHGTE